MTTHYATTLELDHTPHETTTHWIVERLADGHAVATRHDSGNALALPTLPAESLPRAVATAYRLFEPTCRVLSVEAAPQLRDRARAGRRYPT